MAARNENGAPFYWLTETFRCEGREPGSKAFMFRKTMEVDPNNLIGSEFDFFGAHSKCFKLGSMVFECLEDPDDGYRSCWDMLLIHPDQQMSGFFATPLARVQVQAFGANEKSAAVSPPEFQYGFDLVKGWKLADIVDGHVWLEFGTKNYHDYYPYFWFNYQPKLSTE